MRYAVEVESTSYQTYYVEADNPDEAKEKVMSGEYDSYGDVDTGSHHVINVTEE